MKITETTRKVVENRADGAYLIPVNVPTKAWLNVPKNDDELKALINTMILIWEINEAKKEGAKKRKQKK